MESNQLQSSTFSGKESSQAPNRVVVSTHGTSALDACLEHVNEQTSFVHIDGMPFLWVFKGILERAVNLKTIQVIPSMYLYLHKNSHLKICAERNVEVTTGHWRQARGCPVVNRSPLYIAQKAFFATLTADQKALFDELILYGFEEALMAARYFCIKGEPYVSQRAIGTEFGYLQPATQGSQRINALISCLDPTFKTSKIAEQRGRNIKIRLNRILSKLDKQARGEGPIKEYGGRKLPDGLSPLKIESYKMIFDSFLHGGFRALRKKHPDAFQVIILRYGIQDGKFRTLKGVGESLGGVTSQCVQYRERIALRFLKIPFKD